MLKCITEKVSFCNFFVGSLLDSAWRRLLSHLTSMRRSMFCSGIFYVSPQIYIYIFLYKFKFKCKFNDIWGNSWRHPDWYLMVDKNTKYEYCFFHFHLILFTPPRWGVCLSVSMQVLMFIFLKQHFKIQINGSEITKFRIFLHIS